MNPVRTLMVVGLTLLVGGISYAAAAEIWRPLMPQVEIEIVDKMDLPDGSRLMIIYGEEGSNPFRNGKLAPDQRISSCKLRAGFCETRRMKHEFLFRDEKLQSIQVRRLNVDGNPIIGGVTWKNLSNPRRVEIDCDLDALDEVSACQLTAVRH